MKRILGMPRNALIAMSAIVVSAGALALGFLVRWPNAGADAEAAATDAASGGSASKISPLDPTLINVNFDNQAPSVASQTFADQTSVQVQLSGGPATGQSPMSMHLKNAPLLEGVFQLTRASQSYLNEFSTTRIAMYPAGIGGQYNQGMGAWSISGPFAVVVNRIERSVELRGDPARPAAASAVLSGYFYSEPKTKVVQFPTTLNVDEFTDDKQQAITLANTRGINSYSDSNQISRSNFQVPLILPDAPGKHIALLKGSAVFVATSKVQAIQSKELDQPFSQEVGELAVQILPLTANGGRGAGGIPQYYNLQVRFDRNQMEQGQWNQMRNALGRAEVAVFGEGEERLAVMNSNPYNPSSDSVMIQMMVRTTPQTGEAQRIRVEVPVETKEISVPFEFKNLILP